MRFNSLLILYFLLISVATQATEIPSQEKISAVSQNPYWKRLLHYRKNWFGVDKSEADGLDFFLSPHGKTDPKAELQSDLDAFQNPNSTPVGPLKQHAQCAFPERYRFLKNILALTFSEPPCDDFNTWKNRFKARSVTLIYAAAYFGSPSSMFGHTFLRIDSAPREGQKQKNDLLDYGISFDAVMGPNHDFAYPLRGLLGLYPGMYSQMPYYLKINTYSNMDSRDLWEYQVNLTPEQIDRLLNHIWEMGTTHFDYYFFNRNCSYQLLTLFEVANPEWNLKNQFDVKAIPVDTIRSLLQQNQAIRSIHYRPSLLHTLENRLALMDESELARFHITKNNIALIQESDTAKTLDALMDWQKYEALENSFSVEEAERKIDFRLLQLRAKKPNTQENFSELSLETPLGNSLESSTTAKVPLRPDLGHLSSKFSSFIESEAHVGAFGFELRPGFHDLLDPDEGFLPDSALNIGRVRGSVLLDETKTARLDELLIGEVVSYQPFTRLKKYLSWQVSGGLYRPVETSCTACVAEYLQGGAGVTLGTTKASLSVLFTGHTEFSNTFNDVIGLNYRVGPGTLLLGLFKISENLKILGSLEHIRYFPGPDQHYLSKAELALSYHFMPFDLRLQADSFASPQQNIEAINLSLGFWY